MTADTHPIHLHLVQFQLISRQQFRLSAYLKAYNALFLGGVAIPGAGPPPGGNPDPTPYLQQAPILPTNTNEYGWKDTVRMNPGEVTRIAVRFAPTDMPLIGAGSPTPGVNPFSFDPTAGPGYVWHCHIVDHEDNEMMRRLKVTMTGSCPVAAAARIPPIVNQAPPLNLNIPLFLLLGTGGLLLLGSRLMSRKYGLNSTIKEDKE